MKHLVVVLLVVLTAVDPADRREDAGASAANPYAPGVSIELPTRATSMLTGSSPDSHRSPVWDDLSTLGTATVALRPDYEAGRVWGWFFGAYYRDVWTTPLEVPIIDLEMTAGGLTPIERGGGEQTATLHLVGDDGRFYDLRSVNKDASESIPDAYRAPFVRSIVQDQMSALNPLAATIAAPLARAAGILHLDPVLVMVPDSPRLGEFRSEFGGMLALFERDPDENQSDAERFGYAYNVVGTEKLIEELREDSRDRVDERAYARARLFDMLIADWDRHERQWRWAEYETDEGTRFVPVPTDRDVAFSKFDGILIRLVRKSGNMMFRRLANFDDDISDVFGLNWQGRRIDRRIASSLTREDWVQIAKSLQRAMTDDAIDQAVRRLPDPVYQHVGSMTARNLKSRRTDLPSAASSYYDLLSKRVDVFGSDADERFEITRIGRGETRVIFLQRSPDGDAVREIYRREFRRDETDEIRILGLGGNDQIVLYGRADDQPIVRIRGGGGTTAFIDSSAFPGPLRVVNAKPEPRDARDRFGASRSGEVSEIR